MATLADILDGTWTNKSLSDHGVDPASVEGKTNLFAEVR